MELHIIRHGRTSGNQSELLQGWSNSSLLPVQLQSLQPVVFDVSPYDAIYSSDLGRCQETCRALGLNEVIFDERLRERNFGVLENQHHTISTVEFSDVFSRFEKLSGDYQIPEGESRAEHFNRLSSWIESVQSIDRVLVVTHGGTLDFLYRLSSGLDLHGGEQLFVGDNVALSKFTVEWPDVKLLSFSESLAS